MNTFKLRVVITIQSPRKKDVENIKTYFRSVEGGLKTNTPADAKVKIWFRDFGE